MQRALAAALVLLAACGRESATPDSTRADSIAPNGADAPDTLIGLAAALVDTMTGAALKAIDSTSAVKLTEADTLPPPLTIPVQGIVASQLRDTYAEARSGHTHEALDIPAPRGTPVLAAIDGKVTKLHSSIPGGLMVYAADDRDHFVFMYGHLERYADGLAEGMPLRRGQIIGYVGTTGNAPALTPHLHFAVARGRPSVAWWKGTPINPYPLFVGSPVVMATRADSAQPKAAGARSPAEARRTIEGRATAAVAALAAHDMAALARLAHPTKGLRFSPYPYVRVNDDRRFSPKELRDLWDSKTVVIWGSHDGSGAPIRLTFPEYYKSFVFDADFRKAPRIAYGAEPIGKGNSLNNVGDVYPGAIVVEYHHPGVDPRYAGMDWRSLWLVFEKAGPDWFLVGVVHGAWTI